MSTVIATCLIANQQILSPALDARAQARMRGVQLRFPKTSYNFICGSAAWWHSGGVMFLANNGKGAATLRQPDHASNSFLRRKTAGNWVGHMANIRR